MLQFINSSRRFTAEIFDCVLITQPVRPLHGVIHVPGPVIGSPIAQAGRDATLCRDRVAARGKDFGDAGGLQAAFGNPRSEERTLGNGVFSQCRSRWWPY